MYNETPPTKTKKIIPKWNQTPSLNFLDFPSDPPQSDPESHTTAQGRPNTPKGCPRDPHETPKKPQRPKKSTQSSQKCSRDAPRAQETFNQRNQNSKREIEALSIHASSSTDTTLKQYCVENDLGPAECAELSAAPPGTAC